MTRVPETFRTAVPKKESACRLQRPIRPHGQGSNCDRIDQGYRQSDAEGLAQAGATIIVSSRKQDLCNEVADQISSATGSKAIGIACHVGDWEYIRTSWRT